MTKALENERAVIGGNNPPPESKVETWEAHAEELRERSVGIVIANDKQAEAVEELVTDAKKALKDVSAVITEERRPHKEAADAISKSYKPIQTSLEAVRDAAVKVAGAWRVEQQKKRDAEAAEARRIAAEKEAEAAKLAAQTDATEANEVAELRQAEDDAKVAKIEAKKKQTRKVSSGGVRMMTRTDATIIDRKALLIHVAQVADDLLEAWLLDWAQTQARIGARGIPGVDIREWKEAV